MAASSISTTNAEGAVATTSRVLGQSVGDAARIPVDLATGLMTRLSKRFAKEDDDEKADYESRGSRGGRRAGRWAKKAMSEAGANELRNWGFVGFDNSSIRKLIPSMPLTKATLDSILDDPVLKSDDTVQDFVRVNLYRALQRGPNPRPEFSEYVDTINPLGQVSEPKASTRHKDQLRGFCVMLGISVQEGSGAELRHMQTELTNHTSQAVSDGIANLGPRFRDAADAFMSFGIDGAYLATNQIADSELSSELGISNPLMRKVISSHLQKYQDKPLICDIALVCVHLTFNYKPPPEGWFFNTRAPSHEVIRSRVNRLLGYESAKLLMGIQDDASKEIDDASKEITSAGSTTEPMPKCALLSCAERH